MQNLELIAGCLLLGLLAVCLWLPSWWLTGRLDSRIGESLVRLPVSIGIAMVAYLTFVNLVGKLLGNSLHAVLTYFIINAAFCMVLLWKHRSQLGLSTLWRSKRSWLGILLVALLLAFPQWYHAASSNRWDEMASSSIHITAPNQFAEGVFPPRHNAFPEISVKYHYGFTLLSGTVHWITGLESNFSIDIASTALWLFVFLFIFAWLRQLGASGVASGWGSFAVLLGGGLSWLYLPYLQVYEGFKKLPSESALTHSFDPSMNWRDNMLSVFEHQNIHLSNAAGDIFPLPFDVGIHFQQHAVALGIALTLVAAFVFWLWQSRRDFAVPLLIINIFCFGLVFLGHAVFGAIASMSAGFTLLILWLHRPTKTRFVQGILFTFGVTAIAFLHGGMLSTGSEYGSAGAPLAVRESFGYISGNFLDIINWSLAGFGLLLIFTLLSIWIWFRDRHESPQRNLFLIFFGMFTLLSFLIPQFFYFSHAGGVEEQTEISKFFFCTHLGLAVLSVTCVDYLSKRNRWWVILPIFVVTAITPLAVSVAGTRGEDGGWVGIYRSPYDWAGGRTFKETGEALRLLKNSNRDQYYDFSTREVSSGYLNELLVYGGSVFSLSPTRYEVTGFGFLVAEDLVAERILAESRMARLLPGAAESSGTNWIYTVENKDLAGRPVSVRSRFTKMVAEGTLVERSAIGSRMLYEFRAGTHNLDDGIEKYWTPKVIAQTHSDWDGDGKIDLLFFNYRDKLIQNGEQIFSLSDQLASWQGIPTIHLARLPGDERTDIFIGHMADAIYRRGATVSAMTRYYPYNWRRLDSASNRWQSYQQWSWILPVFIPLVADHDGDGFDSQLAYQPNTGQWWLFPYQKVNGPSLSSDMKPLPIVGRFLPGSVSDLAVWSPVNGRFEVQSLQNGKTASMEWGGWPGDVLLPGDYDGDGLDEVGIWQPHINTWWIRNMPAGPNFRYTFGTSTGIPLPADYDDDGKIDLAYWEPGEHRIYVSFDMGQSVGKIIPVPLNSIPIFVQMY